MKLSSKVMHVFYLAHTLLPMCAETVFKTTLSQRSLCGMTVIFFFVTDAEAK